MSVVALAAGAVFALLVASATMQVPRVWRDQHALSRATPSWWPGGRAGWEAFLRGQPIAIASGWPMTVGFFTGSSLNGNGFTPEVGAALASVAGFVLAALLMASAAFVARPRFVIPPALRDRPGLLRLTRDK